MFIPDITSIHSQDTTLHNAHVSQIIGIVNRPGARAVEAASAYRMHIVYLGQAINVRERGCMFGGRVADILVA